MLEFLLAAVAFVALAGALWPLLRVRGEQPVDAQFDRAVFRDQLSELDRDIARGVITDTEAASARLEIQRRLLATDTAPTRTMRLGASPVAAFVVAGIAALGAVGLYARIGSPSLPDLPFAARADQNELAKARRATEANPNDADAWLALAQAAAGTRDWETTAEALRRAVALGRDDADTLGHFGEALTLANGGTVGPAARMAFQAALEKEPGLDAPRYYLAIARGQEGDWAGALEMFLALLADLPADASGRPDIVRRVEEAAKAGGIPMPELPPGRTANADQQAAIRGMVERLAAKMENEPSDLDGWLRLGRAYAVLGDGDKALAAYGKAVALKPSDAGVLMQAVQGFLERRAPTAPVPAEVVGWLQKIESLTPGQPSVLWFLGLASAQEGKKDEALVFWSRLLASMPAEAPETQTLKQAMAALRGG